MEDDKAPFHWTFHHMGGLDQVELHHGPDITHLRSLDPKLWVALSCPAQGLEFDQRTLTLIDTDHDGRIRIPEIMDAADWICARLKDPNSLINPQPQLPLDAINDTTDFGKRILTTAKTILENFNAPDKTCITQQQVTQAALHASEQMLNGDGVLPPMPELGDEMRDYIADAIAVTGGIQDVGGDVGINKEISNAFVQTLSDWREWSKRVLKAETPLGKKTPECWDLLAKLKDKIDDYFMRCELVAYSPQAQAALNLDDKPLTNETGLLEHKALEELPLSKAASDRPLDMQKGLNPAWRQTVERFAQLVQPLLATPNILTHDDWRHIQDALAPFANAVAQKPIPVVPGCVTVPATKTPEELGENRVNQLVKGRLRERFDKLAQDDADGPAASTDMVDMERMVHYYLHLHRLLINFVNFEEFYDNERTAAFQSGSLFIDGRSCHLCMPAGDVEAHSAVAKSSQMFLLYCECSRGLRDGKPDPDTHNIVAAVTTGDSDLLVPNRNGVYVDNQGVDWDAKVVKVVSNPIGIWQAILAPYKKIGSLVTEQISKYANDKQDRLMQSAERKLDEVGAQVTMGQMSQRFDMNRNVGMFAAVGLALGALGTAVGSIFNALLSMSWWQLPLLLLGIFVLISGPSVLLAWLKLRQRTLGPLLEASGWAINGRVSLSYGVAKRLSSEAELPPNSRRSDLDPVVRIKRLRQSVFWIAVGVGIAAALGILMYKEYRHEKETGQLAKMVEEMKTVAEEKPKEEEKPPEEKEEKKEKEE